MYDEYFDDVICPEYRALHYSTGMCTENAKCEKTVLRHVWQNYVEMAVYKELYRLRKEKIERVFADAKEKHSMRYTQYRGLAQVTNWVKLKFAAMNLKKLATWKWNSRHPVPDGGKRPGFRENIPDISLLFPFSFRFANQKLLWLDCTSRFFDRLKPPFGAASDFLKPFKTKEKFYSTLIFMLC